MLIVALWMVASPRLPIIGVAEWCALDANRWECNYNTRVECLTYNDVCRQKKDVE